MNYNKKSLEWLKPLELDSQDTVKFNKIIIKPVKKEIFKKQVNLFKKAKKIKFIHTCDEN